MEAKNPTLAHELTRIHSIITRAIQIDMGRGLDYINSEFQNEPEMHDYVRFNRCLMSVLCSHRQAEELVAFPAFRKVLPLAPYPQLYAEHQQLESLCSLIPEVMSDISGGNPSYGLRVLILLLRKLTRSWTVHIQVEESFFSDTMITPAMNEEIQGEINARVRTFQKDRKHTHYWVVPFLLYDIQQINFISTVGLNFNGESRIEPMYKGTRVELALTNPERMN
jgi:hypothetical protein